MILALTASMLYCLTRLVERKDSIYNYKTFYTQKADFDVLFFGTSHVNRAIYPLELWEDYGIVAQNFGISCGSFPLAYWALINALDYTAPKLVVIDCFDCYKTSEDVKNVIASMPGHRYLDSLPLSMNKIKAIWDLAPSGNRMEYLWDFSVYKERWEELTSDDFIPRLSVEKGSIYAIEVSTTETYPIVDVQVPEKESAEMKYLRRMIEKCQDSGIEVLLMYLPFPANEKFQTEAAIAAKIAEEYGVNYINFLETDIVDYETDCQDPNSHLNASGGRKVTNYLGEYIKENYSIPDQRNDPAYIDWYQDYIAYTNYKIGFINAQKDLTSYLMLLQDEHLSSCVYLAENALWHGDSIYDKLLANMGVDSDRLIAGGPTLAVVDNESNEVEYLACGESAETSFGTVSFALMDGAPKVLVNGAVSMEPAGNAAAAAMVIDDDTGRMVTSSQFAITTTAASVTKLS